MPTREITQEKMRTNGQFRSYNKCDLAPVRRLGKVVNRSPARHIFDHELAAENDPEALSMDFLCKLICSVRNKGKEK